MNLRIASLLPSATEIICALGLREQLVGISHSCDFPGDLDGLPVLTRTAVPVNAPSGEIDAFVRRYLGGHRALYELDLDALNETRADLVVSQRLCDVCAVSAEEVDEALCGLSNAPELIDLEPSCLADIYGDLRRVASAAGVPNRAELVIAALEQRVNEVERRSKSIPTADKPRVAMVEWLDPPFNSGHWMPELVNAAGAVDLLGPVQQPSRSIDWQEVVDARPDVLVLSVCGFPIERTRRELGLLSRDGGFWEVIEAVEGRVLLIDGNSYFARPGPRLVDALEGLAHALHPTLHPNTPQAAWLEWL